MKKRTMIALIVAAALIITGGIILVLGLSFAGDSNGESKLVRQEITIQERFDNIAIDTEDCDVKFAMFSGRDDCMVEVRSYKNVKHTATVEDGTLKIKMIDKRNWTDHINIGWTESMEMTVYLPAAEYASLQVRTTTGDIMILEESSFKEMLLRTSTGDISCVGISGDMLDCMTTTGDISIQNSAPNILQLQSNTGDFAVSVVAGDEIHMRTNTGEVDAGNVNVQMFTCQTETGDVELKDVVAENYLQVFTDTGDVSIERSDAGNVNIETDSGDVDGHFLTPKRISAFSETGDVNVPITLEGGECLIKSNTGDIRIR